MPEYIFNTTGLADVNCHEKGLLQEDQKMSRLPKTIRDHLKEEASEWDNSIAQELPEDVEKLLDRAELFEIPRPPRQPVSIRMDPFDISMVKRPGR